MPPQNPFPQNRAWREGLLELVSLAAGQRLEIPPGQNIQYLVYRSSRNPNPQELTNLVPEAWIRHGQSFSVPLIGMVNLGPRYIAVKVDLGQHTTEFKLDIRSSQNIKGSITINVVYQVKDASILVRRGDALEDLSREIQAVVQMFVGARKYDEVLLPHIHGVLQKFQPHNLGLQIQNIILPNPIEWDPAVAKVSTSIAEAEARARQEHSVSVIRIQTQQQIYNMVEEQLMRRGIRDIETINRVIAKLDPDDPKSNIAKAIQEVLDERRARHDAQQIEAQKRLDDLLEKDKLDRGQVEDIANHHINILSGIQRQDFDVNQPYLNPPQPSNWSVSPSYPAQLPPNYQPPLPSGYNQPSYLPPGQTPSGQTPPGQYPAYPQLPSVAAIIQYGRLPGQAAAPAYLHDMLHGLGNFFLNMPITYIGRTIAKSHIAVDVENQRVSGQHCTIEMRGGQYILRQIKAEQKTWVNGEEVMEKEVELFDGSEIRIGSVCLRFCLPRQSQLPPTGYYSPVPSNDDKTNI